MRDENESDIAVVRAGPAQEDDLEALIARIEAEDHPADPQAAASAPDGMRESLARFDALSSNCVWFLIGYRDAAPAGLAVLTRVPKLDGRIGFLYLDELHVLAEHQRRGVGTALLGAAVDLARGLSLAGIRLLARPENAAARALYESMGFRGNETLLYERRVEPSGPSS